MPEFVGYLLMFTAVGVGFILVNLSLGRLLRPARMNPEKATIYECGEPTVGSAWVQFDLRFYVVALLFVIFDVEMAFFFPWAVVFGKANQLSNPSLTGVERAALADELSPIGVDPDARARFLENLRIVDSPAEQQKSRAYTEERRRNLEQQINAPDRDPADVERDRQALEALKRNPVGEIPSTNATRETISRANDLAWLAFLDILFFFGVLLVGFAYLWRRGDLDWVRSYAAQQQS